MTENYDKWNEVKKQTELNKTNWTIKVKEIYWIKIGKNIGYEIYGKDDEFLRPVLVYKKFNKYSFIGIPLTSQTKDNRWYIKINPYNIDKDNYVIISQIRMFSTKRIKSKFGKISNEDFEVVKQNVLEMLYAQKGLPEQSR